MTSKFKFQWPPFFLKDLGVRKEIMALLNNFIQNSRFAGRFILTLVKIGPKIAVSVMKYIIPRFIN